MPRRCTAAPPCTMASNSAEEGSELTAMLWA
jgi:hypothetical protein